MKLTKPIKIILSILICELAGVVGLAYTGNTISTWYANIAKPSFAPPNWLFGPVWIVLYALMGIAFYIVGQKKDVEPKARLYALKFFWVQLILNAIWTPIFFGLKNPGLAFFELLFLLFFILATIFYFEKVSNAAAWLLFPYLIWVVFAGCLNYSIWQLSGIPVCASDAKVCLNGSTTGRILPRCEFASCATPQSWIENDDATTSTAFMYPADLGTKYIHTTYWPPTVQISYQPFSCKEGGSEIMQNGQTQSEMINSNPYCVTKESEGAAGSVYTTYAYAFPYGNETATLTFTLRFVQCYNYSDPEQSECLKERSSFDMDSIMDQIAGTFGSK